MSEHHCVSGCGPDSHIASPPVPRVAESIDDLRVGQVVAWLPERYGSQDGPPRQCIGVVELRNGIGFIRYHKDNGGGYDTVGFNNSTVFILSDPPPVTPLVLSPKAQELFDRLADVLADESLHSWSEQRGFCEAFDAASDFVQEVRGDA